MHWHLTPDVVRQFGAAFGLWAYQWDVALNGEPQAGGLDLVAVEETDAYAAVMRMIEAQDPPIVVKKEISGVPVYAEEKASALYLVLRQAMVEAYRAAAAQSGPHALHPGR
jgi:hypothetical protein